MTTFLYLAPAASRKTSYTIHLAREKARQLQAEIWVCVPTHLQAHAYRQRLALAGGAIGIHVLTFDNLAKVCLDEAQVNYAVLDPAVQYRLLRTLISQLPLTYYEPLVSKSGFIQETQKLIGELKGAQITPEALQTAVNQMGNEPRLQELTQIYAAYQADLQQHQLTDWAGLHWLAAATLASGVSEACNWPCLIFDGFDDFSSAQLALISQLQSRVTQLVITLTGSVNGQNLPRYIRTREFIESTLDVKAEPLPQQQPAAVHPVLTHLANHLQTTQPIEQIPGDTAVTLIEAPDRPAEVRAALRWLKLQLVQEQMTPGQVALVARDMTPYRPFVQQIAAELGLPIHLVDGTPLSQNPVVSAILNLMRLYLPNEQGEPSLLRRPLLAAWRSPYFHFSDGENQITAADADRLDLLARQQRVLGGLAQWQEAFQAQMKGQAASPLDDEVETAGLVLSSSVVQTLQENFNHFLTLTQPPLEDSSLPDYIIWLERLIGPDPNLSPGQLAVEDSLHIVAQIGESAETAVADRAALSALKDILRGLAWTQERGGSPALTIVDFYQELMGAIEGTMVHLPSRTEQSEILVASVYGIRGLSFQAVAVLGLAEGEFPASLQEDPFLRDEDRRRLREEFDFRLLSSTLSTELEFFYEAVSRPRRALLLTRPVLADNGAEWVASPFWELVRDRIRVTPQTLASEQPLALPEVASWPEYWESVASDPAYTKAVPEPSTWQAIQRAADMWQERLTAVASPLNGNLLPHSHSLKAKYDASHIWSASRLEAYQTCGFFFFINHVLQIEARPEPAEGLDARQLGHLYHHIFEAVYENGLPPLADEAALQAFVTAVAGPILNAAPEEEGFRQTPWWQQTREEIISNVIRSVQVLETGEYTILQTEAAFGFSGPALEIGEGEETIRLHGFIDRIDRNKAGQLRLIDYKLGGKNAFNKKAFAEGKKLQLPLYALAAEKTLGLGEVVDGFYWHFRAAEASPFTLTKAEGGVQTAIETAVTHTREAVQKIRSGHFTPQPPDGGCPSYCPAVQFCWQYQPKGY